MGRGVGTQALELDLGTTPFTSHGTVDKFLNHTEDQFLLLPKREYYLLRKTVVRIQEHSLVFKFYFLLFPRAAHDVMSRRHKK